jgi:ferritin-like metal-binding protein YciE
MLETGDYPHLRALADEMGVDAAWKHISAHLRDTTRFARNLDRLLDGIDASLRKR